MRAVLAAAFLALALARAEQLPVRIYSTADGLARNTVNSILRDSRGFLWFGTSEGLSRFDGYRFTTYGVDQGLPHRNVSDIIETKAGDYWVATSRGVARFRPVAAASEPRFVAYIPEGGGDRQSIGVLLEDGEGILCGSQNGLLRLALAGGQWKFDWVEVGMPSGSADDRVVLSLRRDRQGVLLVGAGTALYRGHPGGRFERYPGHTVSALLEDREGQLWVATHTAGLLLADVEPGSGRLRFTRKYTKRDGLAADWIQALYQSADGKLWVATHAGLSVRPSGNSQEFRSYTAAHGLGDYSLLSLAEDHERNLWIGTQAAGAVRVAREGFVTFGETDGINGAAAIGEDRAGNFFFLSGLGWVLSNYRFDGARFHRIAARLPRQVSYLGWGWHQHALQDHAGEWWYPTGQGLCRFPKAPLERLHQVDPKALYTTRDGLAGNDIWRLFEDSRGDLWISSISDKGTGLTRWDRATGSFHAITDIDGRPTAGLTAASAFAEAPSGNLWIGFSEAGLARLRRGRFRFFTGADGLGPGFVSAIHADRSGRLWVATGEGLSRLDQPDDEHPRFVTFTTRHGLSSNSILCITEDLAGRIYLGTGRGVDRFDPSGPLEPGRIKHYTTADGLARGYVRAARRDRHGNLRFGTQLGVSKLVLQPDRASSPPRIVLSGVRIGGVAYPRLSELGESALSGLILNPDQRHVEIDFVGLGFSLGETLLYQYRLRGDGDDWTQPSERRTVNYANLAPGDYRFEVRVLQAERGVASPPATLDFRILAPLWQRWWFLLSLATAAVLGSYAIYRARLEREIALERVRSRIATDLHDDIGASLARVAILSDVLNRTMDGRDGNASRMASEIGNTARRLVDGTRDIVWSIDPRHDNIGDVVRRVREFASDVLEARGIRWEFDAPREPSKLKLSPEQRRHLFLIFKEAIHNVARHSGCASAALRLEVSAREVPGEVRDDGRGFRPEESSGHGLVNMALRAEQLGGALEVASAPRQGARVFFRFPLKKGSAWSDPFFTKPKAES